MGLRSCLCLYQLGTVDKVPWWTTIEYSIPCFNFSSIVLTIKNYIVLWSPTRIRSLIYESEGLSALGPVKRVCGRVCITSCQVGQLCLEDEDDVGDCPQKMSGLEV